MPCPYAEYGCSDRPQRSALAAHASEAAPRHAELAVAQVKAKTAQLTEKTAENASLKTKCSTQATEIASLKTSHANELKALRARVAHLERGATAAASTAAPPQV